MNYDTVRDALNRFHWADFGAEECTFAEEYGKIYSEDWHEALGFLAGYRAALYQLSKKGNGGCCDGCIGTTIKDCAACETCKRQYDDKYESKKLYSESEALAEMSGDCDMPMVGHRKMLITEATKEAARRGRDQAYKPSPSDIDSQPNKDFKSCNGCAWSDSDNRPCAYCLRAFPPKSSYVDYYLPKVDKP